MNRWKAVWGNVIVLPDKIEDTDPTLRKAAEAIPGFTIARSSEEQERHQAGQIEGTIIDIGGNCFETWKGAKPEIGQKVVYDKFAGFEKEIDGTNYRIINDTDIFMVQS